VPASGFVDLDHTADWAVRVCGSDLPDLFVQAAAGMLSLANPSPHARHPALPRTVRLQAADRESLLVRWLEELHFMLETEGQVPQHIRLTISADLELTAKLLMAPVERVGRAIKAVTFHGLQITATPAGLEAIIVFDI
jgi:SHS2 domain-containing protein